jgi:hypothetical protein
MEGERLHDHNESKTRPLGNAKSPSSQVAKRKARVEARHQCSKKIWSLLQMLFLTERRHRQRVLILFCGSLLVSNLGEGLESNDPPFFD